MKLINVNECLAVRSKQLLSAEEVSRVAEEDRELGLTLEDTRLIKIAMTQCQ